MSHHLTLALLGILRKHIDKDRIHGLLPLLIHHCSITSRIFTYIIHPMLSILFTNMLSTVLALALAGVACALPAEVEKRTTPDASEVYINSIVYGGSGCPQGSLGSFISADRQTSVPLDIKGSLISIELTYPRL
jgi:hypothetical protein